MMLLDNLSVLQIVVAAIIIYEIGWITYCRYFHPLRSIPGPFLASVSRSWIVFKTAKGDMEHTQRALHKKHGYLVRIAPNEVACSDPEEIKIIYGTKNVFQKSDFYDAWKPPTKGYVGHFPSRDEKEHSERRRIVNSIYSMSSILDCENDIDSCTKDWCEAMRDISKQKSPTDLRLCINMYSFDVLGAVLYGKAFGSNSARRHASGDMETISFLLRALTVGGTLPSYLTKLYILVSMLAIPSVHGAFGSIKRLTALSKDGVERCQREMQEKQDDRRDMVRKFFEINADRGERLNFTYDHVLGEAQSILFAGSDSTSIAITAILYYLMRSAPAYKKLTDEIDEAIAHGNLTLPVAYNDAIKLPYLKACINEAMRLHPSVGLPMQRHIPAGGATISGHYFPKGYRVGINCAVVQYDKDVFGADADEYNPDRWIVGDASLMERTMLHFGAGTHTCIGKNISLSEIYKLIPHTLRLFYIRLADPSKELKTVNFWFNKQIGVDIYLEERTHSR